MRKGEGRIQGLDLRGRALAVEHGEDDGAGVAPDVVPRALSSKGESIKPRLGKARDSIKRGKERKDRTCGASRTSSMSCADSACWIGMYFADACGERRACAALRIVRQLSAGDTLIHFK